jgi:hypothetical protein
MKSAFGAGGPGSCGELRQAAVSVTKSFSRCRINILFRDPDPPQLQKPEHWPEKGAGWQNFKRSLARLGLPDGMRKGTLRLLCSEM